MKITKKIINMKKKNQTTIELKKIAFKRSSKKIKYKKYNDKYINFSLNYNNYYYENT